MSASQIKVRVLVTDSRCDTLELASIVSSAVINHLCLSVFFCRCYGCSRDADLLLWTMAVSVSDKLS